MLNPNLASKISYGRICNHFQSEAVKEYTLGQNQTDSKQGPKSSSFHFDRGRTVKRVAIVVGDLGSSGVGRI